PSDPGFESSNSQKMYKLNGNGAKTGLGITLKVMAGDKIDVFGRSYYLLNGGNNPQPGNAVTIIDILNGFLGSPAAATAVHGIDNASVIYNSASTDLMTNTLAQQGQQNTNNPSKPRAYINVIFFDEQFRAVDFEYSAVDANGTVEEHHGDLSQIAVPKNGYVYIYCSNESAIDVYFDNLQVVHTRGALLEENSYYPFGLVMCGISSKAAGILQNQNKYNGKEEQRQEFSDGSGLDWLDYGARMYDIQIGRWMVIDPLASKMPAWSLYSAFFNNPIRYTDPTGAEPLPPDEFDQNGNKISNLGGNKIDFYHQKNGDTKIVDRQTGASNIIKNGESLIRGYTQRDENISWSTIFKEFRQGTGPTKSLISDFDNSNEGAFGLLHSYLSSYSTLARKASLTSINSKGLVKMDYGNANPFVAQDMWEQMIGRSDVSWYKLGDKTLFLMTDSKSRQSLYYRRNVQNWERSEHLQYGNTYQTYIWIESNTDI
ncbi:MAG: hypothetical protein JSU05_14800, partial [Bacteroidetes bacterium]|nr:hypothetical protein [Bacteroidota bacterium]